MSDKRKKVVMKVHEMTEVDAQVISLVKHAANRSPFKILKHQKDGIMKHINLSNLFKKADQKEAEPTPVVVSLVTKTEKATVLVSEVNGKGLSILKQEDLDGATTLHLTESDSTDTVIIKMSDDVAVGVTGIKKSFSSWSEGESFVQQMAISGFFPGVRVATDVYLDTLGNIMYKSEAGSPPVVQIAKLNDDFARYVNTLVSNIPVEAFKFEGMVLKEEAKAPETAATEVPAVEGEAQATEGAPAGETIVKEGETTAEVSVVEDKTVEGGGATETAAVTEGAQVPKAASEVTKAEVETLISSQVTAGLETINKSVADIVKKQEDAMTALMEKFENVTKALKGVVSFETVGDGLGESVKKTGDKPKGTFDAVLKFEGYEGQ